MATFCHNPLVSASSVLPCCEQPVSRGWVAMCSQAQHCECASESESPVNPGAASSPWETILMMSQSFSCPSPAQQHVLQPWALLVLQALMCSEVIMCVYDNGIHPAEDCDIKAEIFLLHCMIKYLAEKKIQNYHEPLERISLIKIKVTSTMLPLEMFCQVAIATSAM